MQSRREKRKVGDRPCWRALLCVLAAFSLPAWPSLAQTGGSPSVVPDGSTATSVSLEASGCSLVALAPLDSRGTSLNRYSQFDVTAAGVALDNQGVKAATIVNEVTSTRSSTLAGALSILGPSANLLIANPNGIVLQSGTFVNVRNLGLTTASVSPSASGAWSLPLRRGQIRILGDAIRLPANVFLAGKELRLEAPLVSSGTTAGQDEIHLISGSQDLSLDGLLSDAAWLQAGASLGASHDQAALVLAGSGSLQAGDIHIIAHDGPAASAGGGGLELAGEIKALGGLALASRGDLTVSAAALSAGQDLVLRARSLELAANSSFEAKAGAVLLSSSAGDLRVTGSRLSGVKRKSGEALSRGGLSLDAAGRLQIEGSQLDSSRDDLSLVSGQDLSVAGSQLVSSQALVISSQAAAAVTGTQLSAGEDIRLLADAALSLEDIRADAASDMRLDGQSVRLSASMDREAYLKASQGGLTLVANSGDISNLGVLLQGARKDGGDVVSQGAVTLISSGDILNQSLAAHRLAAIFGQDGDVWLQAGGAIRNINGRLLSNAAMRLSAGGHVENRSLTNSQGLALGAEIAYLRAEKDLSINADHLTNIGGEISAASISARLTTGIEQRALILGRIGLRKRRCFWFACSYSLRSQPVFSDASIRADGDLGLQAGSWIVNHGGSFLAGEDLVLDAPSQRSLALALPLAYQRPGGLNRLFLWPRVFRKAEGQGGQILAGGDLTLTGELSRRGGSLMAGKALSLSTPERFSVLAGGATPISIGWFGRLLARLEPR